MKLTGAEILMECLLEQGVDVVFGYPGGTILNVYTKPEHRHHGYAKKLMELMLDDAGKMKLDFVELKATEDGYGLYKKIGFKDAVSKYYNMKYVL